MRLEVLKSSSSSSSLASQSNESVFNPFGSRPDGSAADAGSRRRGSLCPDTLTSVGSSAAIWTTSAKFAHSGGGLRKRAKAQCIKLTSKENLASVFPIIKWAPQYTKGKLISDIIAGITVGLTVLPQGLAYATVAGLPPIYGLYSGFAGCFVYILFGGTKAITIGPNAIQCILTWKYVNGRSPDYAVFFCFTSGLIFLLMYIFRLSFITNFISIPVVSGFTSGVALTIVATQVKGLLGISFHQEGFLPTIQGTIDHIYDVKPGDAYLSLICCGLLLFLKKLQFILGFIGRRFKVVDQIFWFISTSRSAIIIIGCTVISALQYPNQSYSIVGPITPGLPEVKPPPVSIFDPATNTTNNFGDLLAQESTAVIIMPLLGLMGHMTIAKVFAGSSRVPAANEILSCGISNLISCFFSSMPIVGSFSRTTVNAMSGAESPVGGAVTGTMVLLALQFLTPTFFFIPKASLASVVVCSVIFMVDLHIVLPMWRSKKMDLLPWAVTVLVTLFVGLEYGIGIGLVISAMFILYYAAKPGVKILRGFTGKNSEFILVQLDRSLSFPAVDYITDVIGKAALRYGNPATPIVIDCHHIMFADFTAATAMSDMVANFSQFDYTIIFWKLKPSMLRILGSVMANNSTEFTHCSSNDDLEDAIDRTVDKIKGSVDLSVEEL